MREIYTQLKDLRLASNLTQAQIAEKLGSGGYTNKAVSDIENGRRKVGWSVIQDWAKACGKEAEIVFKNMKP
ncbi:helix-turn-helix domain-containing protein [Dyadobacter chenwenxiniae]|uniref:helix-turn-helix domain-containing protein n=1 Tax=Dyadobacter chenwenxiniae TaxID=2906456 RepID=UPI0035B69EA1